MAGDQPLPMLMPPNVVLAKKARRSRDPQVKLFTSENIQTGSTILTLVGTMAAWLFNRYVVRRRRLSYRVHWNQPVDVAPGITHGMDLAIMRGGEVVVSPSLVVLRVENVGSVDIDSDDVRVPLEFSFGGRRIVHFEIQETDPPELADDILRSPANGSPELMPYHGGEPDEAPAGVLRLPPFGMARRDRFKLLLLLSGTETRISARGLSRNELVREGPRRAWSQTGVLLGGLSLMLVGLLVGLILTRGTPSAPVSCQSGSLSVTGSTALYPAMNEIAAQYMKKCPGADIQVDPTGTNTAVQQLVEGGRADAERDSTEAARVKLAMADEYAAKPVADPQLQYWPIGVGVFAVIVNRQTRISQLTSAQIRLLYAGQLPRWNDADLGGSDEDVVLVSRAVGSGTRDTFADRVLRGPEKSAISSSDCLSRDIPGKQGGVVHCALDSTEDVLRKVSATPGAIGYASAAEAQKYAGDNVEVIPIDGYFPTKDAVASGRYRFWAVEKLYRYGQERPPTVRDHFVRYLLSQPSAQAILEKYGFFSCTDSAFLAGEVATACGEVSNWPSGNAAR